MQRYRILLLVLLWSLCGIQQGYTQSEMFGVSSVYDDSFREWVVYFDQEEDEGYIQLKWPLKNDWTQWEVNVGEMNGFIRSRGNAGNVYWESKMNNLIISARPVYPRDFSQWIIKSGDEQVRLKVVYNDSVESWSIEFQDVYFDMFTSYLGDVRDWTIEDTALDVLSPEMKLTAMVIVLYYSCPHQ